jgi:hypothetical protein
MSVVCQYNSIQRGAVDFKTATDILSRRITADEIADAAGVSISSIARARLDPASSAYRSPPEDWETVLFRLALARSEDLKELAELLERQKQGSVLDSGAAAA